MISNRSWNYNYTATGGKSTTTNKYSQATLASWLSTTIEGTSVSGMVGGLNTSVRRPAGKNYFGDSTGTDGNLFSKVITDVYWNAIGVALGVKLTTQLKLFSWSGFSGTAWHWIAIRGYSGYGTSTKRLYYNDDSSSGWGGATGVYSDTLNLVWQVNQANTGNIVW